jgi:hypothetical protein
LRQRKDDNFHLVYPVHMKPTDGIEPALAWSVARLLRQRPQLVRLFITHHMACPGCAFSPYHSLERALEIYSLPRSTFREALDEVDRSPEPRAEADSLKPTKEEIPCDSDP